MDKLTIRQLRPEDAAQYRIVRLRALQEHPEAFGSSAEDFEQRTLADLTDWLGSQSETFSLFGAFVEGDLTGLIGFGRQTGAKVRHRGGIYHMYVTPETRGRGLGRQLMQTAMAYAMELDGLEDIVLAVTVGNNAARSLYESFGFVSSHRDPRYIKMGDRYYDIDWMRISISSDQKGNG